MYAFGVVLVFVLAHIVAWYALGGGWRGAARAPFAILIPALALLLLHAVVEDAFQSLPLKIGTLLSWEVVYFLGYLCLRLAWPTPARP